MGGIVLTRTMAVGDLPGWRRWKDPIALWFVVKAVFSPEAILLGDAREVEGLAGESAADNSKGPTILLQLRGDSSIHVQQAIQRPLLPSPRRTVCKRC